MIEKGHSTAAEIISRGGVAIIPTDTIYGFSCDPRISRAVDRIRELKNREDKPFLIIESSLERLKKDYYCPEDDFTKKIIDLLISNDLWPGRITLLSKKNPGLNYSFLDNFSKIGVRYTDNVIVNYLCSFLGCGLASTSINISGQPHSNDIDHIISKWSDKVDYILNSGEISKGSESTIIDLESITGTVRFVRKPDIYLEEKIIKALTGHAEICH